MKISNLLQIGALLLAVTMAGCSSMERVINFPQQRAELTIDGYDTSTHNPSTNIFIPVDISKKVKVLEKQQKVETINIIVDKDNANDRIGAENILKELLWSTYGESITIQLWQTGGEHKNITVPNESQIKRMEISEPDSKFSDNFQKISEEILNQKKPTAVVIIKNFQSYTVEDQDAIDMMRLKAQHLARKDITLSEINYSSSYDNICVYTIGPADKYAASVIDRADWCGYSITANQLRHGRNASHFMEDMIYGMPSDDDRDGIPNHIDQCAGTPSGTLVDANGCAERIE